MSATLLDPRALAAADAPAGASSGPATSSPATSSPATSRQRWAGRVLSGLAATFLGVNAVVGLLALPPAVEGTRQLGFDPAVLLPFALIQLAMLALYLVPRTAVLGAVLWTGWLGGAIATHVRHGDPLFTHVLFPFYVATPLWLGLWLRDARVRAALGPAR